MIIGNRSIRGRTGLWGIMAMCAVVLGASVAGCTSDPPQPPPTEMAAALPALEALGAAPGEAIVAQGQLEPAGGVIAIAAPPGDRVQQILVSEGDEVTEGQTLGRLESLEARRAELAVAQTRLDEARAKLQAEQTVADARLEVAAVGLKQAQLQLQQATEQLETAEAEGGRLDLLGQRVELAQNKLSQLQEANRDPAAGRLVNASTLAQQQLEVQQAQADLNAARQEAEAGIAQARLAVEAAQKDLQAAELAVQAAQAGSPIASLEGQVNLLRLQVESTQLVSPIDGTVLAIDVGAGESTSGAPLMRLADTTRMVCRAEVHVAQLPRVQVGARAAITSAALDQPLAGHVQSISRIIGAPRLPNASPLARVDWRSAAVVIEIDPQDAPRAARLVHLQVDVAIATVPSDRSPTPDDAGEPSVTVPTGTDS